MSRELSDVHQSRRIASALELLTRYEHEGFDFLKCIVTGDESWFHYWTPEYMVEQNFDSAVSICKTVVHRAYKEHAYLVGSSKLNADQKEICRRWISDVDYKSFMPVEIEEGAKLLTEYPYLDNIISFAMEILNALVKDNEFAERGFLTDISQICSLGVSRSSRDSAS